ncbi:MAG: aminotransferase class V-fold PLP-dependent enzyme [Bacteroidetes bacterium]|jgi:selenocysteine lyase/cysteine desulfurase|nr:aminotransferase class V-fold PLP-dependent enzyme [Bacteroidota bacterium]
MDLSSYRPLFPYLENGMIYFNHAATSPLSTRVVEAMQRHLNERSSGPVDTYFQDLKAVDGLRSSVARLIHAPSPDRIAFVVNTSDAINMIAAAFPWRSGDRILLNSLEFPANVYPYINLRSKGVHVDILSCPDGRVTAGSVERALTPSTRLVAVSAVQFLTGYRADLSALGALCRSRNVRLVVDGIQAVGAVPIDVQAAGIDALACGAQKWMMSPHGTGFAYLSEELQGMLQQQYLGWLSVADPWNFRDHDQPLAASARRYEGGTLNYPGLMGMRAAVEMLLEVGTDAIERQIRLLTDRIVEHLSRLDGWTIVTPLEPKARSGIITARRNSADEARQWFDRLLSRRVTISLREGQLRFSPHFYNTTTEVDELFLRLRS